MEPTLESAETPAKPPKQRRRWLIVAFVLVFVSLCSWWYWPRGDARFVGKWLHSSPGVLPQKGFALVLFADGTGSISYLEDDFDHNGQYVTRPIGWWFRGSELSLLQTSDSPPNSLARFWGFLGGAKSSRLRIVSVTDHEIHYRTEAFGSFTLVMHRVE